MQLLVTKRTMLGDLFLHSLSLALKFSSLWAAQRESYKFGGEMAQRQGYLPVPCGKGVEATLFYSASKTA